MRLRLATDVDFALVQDDHQRNSHARDVTSFADIGDEDFAAFVNRPQNYLEFFAGIFLEHGRGSRKKNSRIQVLSELFHGLFFVRRQAFLDFFKQIRDSLACGGVHVRNAPQKHEMQHGVFKIREQQVVRRFNCRLIKVGSSVAAHADIGASINGGKEIHVSLHIATLVFRNLQCGHQIVDGVGSARIRNQERKKLDGAFAAGNFCHNKPLKRKYIIIATNNVVVSLLASFFHVKLYNCGSLNKNAPAQSYLSGGRNRSQRDTRRELDFCFNLAGSILTLWLQLEFDPPIQS